MDNSINRHLGMSRRDFLLGATATGAAAVALGRMPAHSQTPIVTPKGEAPELRELVDGGELPALADRLPRNPAVVAPLERVGRYGGTFRHAQTSSEINTAAVTLTRASLVEWSLGLDFTPIPGLAESWKISDDATTYTFKLREGLKWSDGEPYTADDILFAVNDVALNTELMPSVPTYLTAQGEPVAVEKLNDYTVVFTFPHPNGLFPRFLAFTGMGLNTPKHYLSQFHPDYAGLDAVNQMASGEGFESWIQLYGARANSWTNPELPSLGAWHLTQPIEGSSTRASLERNPYYWKVDIEGNQLPYADGIVIDVMDKTAVTLRAASGEIDLQYLYLGFQDMPVLTEGQEAGNYTVRQWGLDAPWVMMYMNQSHKDPAIRELMQNIDFRAGLSHAINREEMNEILFLGLGGTQHPCALPEDPYYVDGYGYRFTEFDIEEANARLDAAGLTERGSDGFRLRPDGEPLELTILAFEFESGVNAFDAYELVITYWAEVGINANLDVIDRTLWYERVPANEADIPGFSVAGLLWDIDPLWYVPTSRLTYWGPLFGIWYATGGEGGEEPPPHIQQLQILYDQLVAEPDDAKRLELGQEILKAHDENVYMIGTVTTPFQPVVVKNNLVNVLENGVHSNRAKHEEVTWFEQVWFDDE